MFYESLSLEEIIISNFDTENIDDMSYLFYNKKNKYFKFEY